MVNSEIQHTAATESVDPIRIGAELGKEIHLDSLWKRFDKNMANQTNSPVPARLEIEGMSGGIVQVGMIKINEELFPQILVITNDINKVTPQVYYNSSLDDIEDHPIYFEKVKLHGEKGEDVGYIFRFDRDHYKLHPEEMPKDLAGKVALMRTINPIVVIDDKSSQN